MPDSSRIFFRRNHAFRYLLLTEVDLQLSIYRKQAVSRVPKERSAFS